MFLAFGDPKEMLHVYGDKAIISGGIFVCHLSLCKICSGPKLEAPSLLSSNREKGDAFNTIFTIYCLQPVRKGEKKTTVFTIDYKSVVLIKGGDCNFVGNIIQVKTTHEVAVKSRWNRVLYKGQTLKQIVHVADASTSTVLQTKAVNIFVS